MKELVRKVKRVRRRVCRGTRVSVTVSETAKGPFASVKIRADDLEVVGSPHLVYTAARGAENIKALLQALDCAAAQLRKLTAPAEDVEALVRASLDALSAMCSGDFANFALMRCIVQGEPSAAIVVLNTEGTVTKVTPMFVALTPTMSITDPEGIPPS